MEVLTKGRPQKGWSKEFTCTGAGNRGGGCKAQLLVSVGDLYHTYGSALHESYTYTTFMCPECGVETDITDHSYPSCKLPSKSEWLKHGGHRDSNAVLTVDVVILLGGTEVVLIKRAKYPHKDKLVLPGGHLEKGEELREACVREIAEEVGFIASSSDLKLLTVLDDPKRDPRPGRRISAVFLLELPTSACNSFIAGSDAAEVIIRPLSSLTEKEIGFDHWSAILEVTHTRR